jgi:hypothetical protein
MATCSATTPTPRNPSDGPKPASEVLGAVAPFVRTGGGLDRGERRRS